jgi:hypothetical protein
MKKILSAGAAAALLAAIDARAVQDPAPSPPAVSLACSVRGTGTGFQIAVSIGAATLPNGTILRGRIERLGHEATFSRPELRWARAIEGVETAQVVQSRAAGMQFATRMPGRYRVTVSFRPEGQEVSVLRYARAKGIGSFDETAEAQAGAPGDLAAAIQNDLSQVERFVSELEGIVHAGESPKDRVDVVRRIERLQLRVDAWRGGCVLLGAQAALQSLCSAMRNTAVYERPSPGGRASSPFGSGGARGPAPAAPPEENESAGELAAREETAAAPGEGGAQSTPASGGRSEPSRPGESPVAAAAARVRRQACREAAALLLDGVAHLLGTFDPEGGRKAADSVAGELERTAARHEAMTWEDALPYRRVTEASPALSDFLGRALALFRASVPDPEAVADLRVAMANRANALRLSE